MRRTSFGVAAAVVAIGVGAAACGSGDGSATTTDGFKNNVGGSGSGVTVSVTVGAGAGTTASVGVTTGSNTTTTTGSATTSTGSSTGSGSGGVFKAAEPWNTAVDGDPADPASDAIIQSLTNAGGWGTGNMQIDFSITLQHSDGTMKPFVQSGDFYSPDCDDIPSFPVPNGGAVEGESGYACNGDGDCHLLVIDDSSNKLYEMWRAFAPPDPNTFNGGCAVVWDLTKAYPNNLRGDGCTSADAGGFPISAMLFTADEVAAGTIDHAIRFILPNSRIRGGGVYVHPGTHTTNTTGDSNAPPYGVRFRLKSSFDTSSLSGGAKIVAAAMKKYGMFLSDGGNIALTAADDRFSTAKWANVDLDSHGLSSLQVSDFEVVDMGSLVTTGDDCVRNP